MLLEPKEFLDKLRKNINNYHTVIKHLNYNLFVMSSDVALLHNSVSLNKPVYVIMDSEYKDLFVDLESKDKAIKVKDFYYTPAFELIKVISN